MDKTNPGEKTREAEEDHQVNGRDYLILLNLSQDLSRNGLGICLAPETIDGQNKS